MHKAHLAAQTDKEITERMIKSIMPPLFTHVFGRPEDFKMSVARVHRMRPLFIYPVNQISILFADIVGFTRMSSKKTAEELVFLLNDLYGRFDRLCEKAGCEKISTLGDCYYCVSGCLNGRDDHAKCCVEMGLLMVKEIEVIIIHLTLIIIQFENYNKHMILRNMFIKCILMYLLRFELSDFDY